MTLTDLTAPPNWVFDHVGLVVKSLEKGRSAMTGIFPDMVWTDPFDDNVNGVRIQFGRDPTGMVHELLVPLGLDSPVAAALHERRDLLNHLAYRVADLCLANAHMRSARCAATAPAKPALAYGGRLIQFFVTPINTIIELIEAPDHDHSFSFK